MKPIRIEEWGKIYFSIILVKNDGNCQKFRVDNLMKNTINGSGSVSMNLSTEIPMNNSSIPVESDFVNNEKTKGINVGGTIYYMIKEATNYSISRKGDVLNNSTKKVREMQMRGSRARIRLTNNDGNSLWYRISELLKNVPINSIVDKEKPCDMEYYPIKEANKYSISRTGIVRNNNSLKIKKQLKERIEIKVSLTNNDGKTISKYRISELLKNNVPSAEQVPDSEPVLNGVRMVEGELYYIIKDAIKYSISNKKIIIRNKDNKIMKHKIERGEPTSVILTDNMANERGSGKYYPVHKLVKDNIPVEKQLK